MAQYPNLYNVELTKGPAVVQLEQMFLGDVLANRIGAIVTENGEAVTLGGTCSGTAILSNGGTVSVSGTVSGNTCYIDLPSAVYAVEGPVEIFVANVSGGKTTTLVAAFGNVRRTQTGSIIDPGTIIPSVSALIDAIDTAVASIPADYTALLAAVAPTFSSSTAYTAGRYVWYSGNLYRFAADHAAGSWAGTDAVQVVAMDDVSGLKNAINGIGDAVYYDTLSPEKACHTKTGYFVKGYGDGSLGPNVDWSAVETYIPIKPDTAYTIARHNNIQGAFYDSSKTFISGIIDNSGVASPYSVTSPSNAAYVRLSSKTVDFAYLGLYEGVYGEPALSELTHVPKMIGVETIGVTHSNYATLLPDANAVMTNSVFKMYFNNQSTDIPANLPFTRWITNKSVLLITFAKDSQRVPGSYAGAQQLCIGQNFVFAREYNSAWDNWQALHLEIGVGTGYGVVSNFTSLTEAVVFATQYKNAIVNVYNGTFDLFTEFKALYGDDFFDNYAADTRPRGLHLSNNVTIRCSSNSKIVFNYTGDNANVKQQFSPINFLSDCLLGFTLENATVECSNCRYVVHDDPGDFNSPYHNVYKNCKFVIDNRNNTPWPLSRAIGGGLGRAGHVRIENCLCIGKVDTPSVNNHVVFYHVDVYSDSGRSLVEMAGSYLDGGTFAALYGGNNAEYFITNNSMYGDVIIAPNSGTPSDPTNITVYEWNNINRATV